MPPILRGYYRRVMAGDWGGFFRRDVEARMGGVAMTMAGPVGSVEMPVVFPAATRVSRTPVVGPGRPRTGHERGQHAR